MQRPGLALLVIVLVGAARPATAQTLQGRVLDDRDDRPVATALVRLVDESGEERALTVADSSGGYVLDAPGPGVFRIQAERLGYDDFETLLLEAQDPEGVYPLDLMMRRSPVPIRGLEVTAEHVDQRVQLMLGLDPRSLRAEPVRAPELRDHAERSHDLADMMRWQNLPGIEVMDSEHGPCFFMRRYRVCMPVYLNGFPISTELTPALPLDMIYTMVVVFPTESILYPSGGVLLYTEAWLR